jgi:hypothetical protein
MKTVGCALLALLASVIYSQIAWNVISAPSITGEDLAMAMAYGVVAGLAAGGLVLLLQGRVARRAQTSVCVLAVKPSLLVRQQEREMSEAFIDCLHIIGWQSLDKTGNKEI